MIKKRQNIIAVLPAFNAEKTLVPFLKTLPKEIFNEIILVDDCSADKTYQLARQQTGIKVYRNLKNLGYGGNMKRCLKLALDRGADIIVEIHPDGEYGTSGIIPALEQVRRGADLVLGKRFNSFSDAFNSGMFFWKYPVTKVLTKIDNFVLGSNIADMHQGFRVYTRKLLEKINFNANSNDFLFTFQIIVQARCYKMKIVSVPVDTNYRGKKRGVTLLNGFKYFIGTFWVLMQYLLARLGFRGKFLKI